MSSILYYISNQTCRAGGEKHLDHSGVGWLQGVPKTPSTCVKQTETTCNCRRDIKEFPIDYTSLMSQVTSNYIDKPKQWIGGGWMKENPNFRNGEGESIEGRTRDVSNDGEY